MKNILAIPGSLRASSANLSIIENIAEMLSGRANVTVYEGLNGLPHFNPDLDADEPPPAVADLRRRIRAADGVLICAPEYVFSIPGALKNALEWTVSSSDFSGRPTALITASGLGEKAHESLFLVLQTIEARIDRETALLISGARAKIDGAGRLSDEPTIAAVNLLIAAFLRMIEE